MQPTMPVSSLEPASAPAPFPAHPILVITALWALTESSLGGLLHAFRIPFTGLVIGSLAVIFISMIARQQPKTGTLLKSTILVILVKAALSPHSPVTAYFAVFLQGLLGELWFFNARHLVTRTIGFGLSVGLFSALQKFLIITLLFGTEFWEAIDVFVGYILSQVNLNAVEFSIGLTAITLYGFLHMAFGFLAAMIAIGIPKQVESMKQLWAQPVLLPDTQTGKLKPGKGRKWYSKPSGWFVIIMFSILGFLSVIEPGTTDDWGGSVLWMIIRSLIILILWFTVLNPLLHRLLVGFISSQKRKYLSEMELVLALLPSIKIKVYRCWVLAGSMPNFNQIKRIKTFLTLLLVVLVYESEFKNK